MFPLNFGLGVYQCGTLDTAASIDPTAQAGGEAQGGNEEGRSPIAYEAESRIYEGLSRPIRRSP